MAANSTQQDVHWDTDTSIKLKIAWIDSLIDGYAKHTEGKGYPNVILVPVNFIDPNFGRILVPIFPEPGLVFKTYRGVVLHEVHEIFSPEIFPDWAYASIDEYLQSRKVDFSKVNADELKDLLLAKSE